VYDPIDPDATKVAMTIADQLFEQAKQLPEPLAREALDFVLFLRARYERQEWRDLMNAQISALVETWDNEADEAWNNV
jgi:hypothetical protein